MARCHVYDWVLEPQLDLKSISNVSLVEDTKPKTHMDFSYTIKAMRSKKNVV